jgi:hypothetical protein
MAEQPSERPSEGQVPNPEPKAKPEATAKKPEADTPEPKAKAAQPEAKAAKPEPKAAKAEAKPTKAKTETAKAEPSQPAADVDYHRKTGLFTSILQMAPSWLVSMVVHIVALLVLAIINTEPPVKDTTHQVVASVSEAEELEELTEIEEPLEQIDLSQTELLPQDMPSEQMEVAVSPDTESATVAVDLSDIGLEQAPKSDLLASVGAYTGSALAGRTANKQALVAASGGSEASERAVAAALKWLAAHQMPDGGWTLAHGMAPNCRNQCRNPGERTKARVAATGLALLPFLGAGQTHKAGQYKKEVRAGLYYLVSQMKVSPQGGSLVDQGNMYSHGIGAIVLCEAYAMTHDKGLYTPAQQAVNFICYAQDPVGGGWRYQPRQKGDTSVVGWQIMALKSGHMAYLRIPPITIKKASHFLDAVQANGGANYGYTDPGSGPATTAIGLLCRMYLGWKHDTPALEKGVKWIAKQGPSKTNMYYNYYATQVMRHWEGEEWKKWNAVMRDMLVKSQATKGHEAGSWCTEGGDHSQKSGGRLYCTAMATMILEVYYRHLPIYRKQSTDEKFPLD